MADIRILIDVNTDGDAFRDMDETDGMRRAFRDAENAVFHSENFGRGVDAESILFDKNGNRCGRVRLVYETEPATAPRYTSFRNGDTRNAAPLYDGNRNDTRTCECGAPRVQCRACGVWRFACAACPCDATEPDDGFISGRPDGIF